MTSPIDNLISHTHYNKPLNILVYAFDGCFEHYLSKVCPQHNFYCLKNTVKVRWNQNLWKVNNNMYVSVAPPQHIVFDCVLCNDISHHKSAQTFARVLHVPLILMEHAVTRDQDQNIGANYHYVAHEKIGKSLQIVNYGVDKMDKIEKKHQIVIISDFTSRDLMVIQDIMNKSPLPVRIFGQNAGLSEVIDGFDTYKGVLEESLIYLHLTSDINIPINVLHAMSAGCIVVANRTPLLDTIINDECGCLVDNVQEILSKINNIKSNPEKYIKHGDNARKYIDDNFSIGAFSKHWNNTFKDIKERIFIPTYEN